MADQPEKIKTIMKNYFVEYKIEGENKTIKIEASDPGHAFQKAVKKLPKRAKITRAHIEGRLAGRPHFARVWIDYDAPKNPRLKAPKLPVEKLEQIKMPFVA